MFCICLGLWEKSTLALQSVQIRVDYFSGPLPACEDYRARVSYVCSAIWNIPFFHCRSLNVQIELHHRSFLPKYPTVSSPGDESVPN